MPTAALAVLSTPDVGAPPSPEAYRFTDPTAPQIGVLDLGVTRGDGVFETVGIGGGRAQALEAHLARLVRSAALLEMPEPDVDSWRQAVIAVADRLPADREAFAKLVYTRGPEGGDRPTAWVYGTVSPDHTRARTTGVAVAVLDHGTRHDVAGQDPWLLLGAKTLSYAVNRAAVREAHRRGAEDVLFVSSDGYLLEGATSTLLLKRGDRLMTPSTSLGILAGTTQADAFRFARGLGMTTSYELLPKAALDTADALWLLSSVRNAAPIRAIDGVARPVDDVFTAVLNAYLLGRRD